MADGNMNQTPTVLHTVYNLIRGGTEGQCARIAVEMARHVGRHRVAVFRREGFFLDEVERVCGPVYELGIQHLASRDTFRRVRQFCDFLQAEGIGLLHAWDADAAIFGSVAARWAGIPYITSRRDLGQIYPWYKLWLMRRADTRAAAVVVNAEAVRDGLVAGGLPRDRIIQIPNVLDLREFDRLAAEPFSHSARLPPGRLIGMVARLDPEKDVATLIRAAAAILPGYDDVHVVIAGDGPERPRLERLALGLGIDEHVVFLGEITDVPALLKRLAIGVLVPRHNEGLSNSILEYQAAGLPVVATDCGGNRELLQNGASGVLMAPGDVPAVAEALRSLLDHSDLAAAQGVRGRRMVETNNNPDNVIRRFSSLYSGLLPVE
jgi:L-malate glycosyltransferase